MHFLIIFVLCFFIASPARAQEIPVLKVDLKSEQVSISQKLGSLNIDGAGSIIIFASKERKLLVLQAISPEGSVIGRAESVAGVSETPIFINTAKGLQQIIIRWKNFGK